MSAERVLDDLARRGVELWVDGDRLGFKASRDALDPQSVDTLRAHKQAVIDLLMRRGGSQRRHPLSYGQRSLWFMHQVAPDTAAYNVAYPWRVRSKLDAPALARALRRLTARHGALRTSFIECGGESVQEIFDAVEVPLVVREVGPISEAALAELVETEYRRPFDLREAPLFRAAAFSLAEDDHVLLLVLHHIVCDGWSVGVILNELGPLYEAEATGREPAGRPHAPQYVDFVHWQRRQLEDPAAVKARDYWLAKLGGDLPALDLPTDFPRPPVPALRGASHTLVLCGETTAGMKKVAQANNATLHMYLTAVFQVLLHRHSGQEDILVGTPSSGRGRPEFVAAVGHLVNMIVLRCNLQGNPRFVDFLQQVRGEALRALNHQDYPFALLVQHLQPNRDLSRSPIFQAMLVMLRGKGLEERSQAVDASGGQGTSTWGGMRVEPFMLAQQEGQFDLTLEITEMDETFLCRFKYDAELFSKERIAAMAGHFKRLIKSIGRNPQERVGNLPMLSDEELHCLLEERRGEAAPWLQDRCVHHLFEAQARATPDVAALIVGARPPLTYRELDERADRLASHLRSLGVGPEQLVAVILPRDVSLVVALLGVMKAGGAYVPVDPRYPAERVGFMIEDADASVVVTTSELAATLPSRARTICLDTEGLDNEGAPLGSATGHCAFDANVAPHNLAYVLFTSGSTGRPKGVQIEHHSAVAMLCWARDAFSPEELSVVLASTSVCFDLSVFEIFAPLSWGGAVALAENALELPLLPAASQITLVNTVPSAIAELARVNGVPDSVRTINLAGEPLKGSLVQELYRKTKAERVLNLYGPTEDTTYSTWTCVERDDPKPPTIGRPLSNSQTYLLSPHLQLAPIGAVGELYLAGAGLARGYLKRPELTAERFLHNPFSADPAARMYRTGDFARYLPNGEIQYLGRTDSQVKLRGYRIELGEIEDALSKFPGVGEVAVVARRDGFQTAKLVAYVSGRSGGQALEGSELRAYVKGRLPHYMEPTDFIILESMPHTPNGKIDRAALPEPFHGDAGAKPSAELVGPLLRLIMDVWSETFGGQVISPSDNFFSIGGHSLLAAKVVYRLRELLGVPLGIGVLFEHATPIALRDLIEALQDTKGEGVVSPCEVDLAAEAALDPDLKPSASSSAVSLDDALDVLLTGATGFVGSYLLMELLLRTRAVIHCLVRAKDETSAWRRIAEAAQRHGFGGLDKWSSRIRLVIADLNAPWFGLPQAEFDGLAEQIDVIFHCAASINLAYSYDLLKPTNVDGVREVIRLACARRVKQVHYLSTISVFDAPAYFDGRTIFERDEPSEIEGLDHGYPQSKWVAERLVRIAAERGLPVVVHRLGAVIGASDSGVWRANDFLHGMLSAAIELGLWLDADFVTNLTPVDYVARSILELAKQKTSLGRTFHIVPPNAVRSSEIRQWLIASGLKLRNVTAAEWRKSLADMFEAAHDARWPALLTLLDSFLADDALGKLVEWHANSPRFDSSETATALASTPVRNPVINEALIRRYLSVSGNFGGRTAPLGV